MDWGRSAPAAVSQSWRVPCGSLPRSRSRARAGPRRPRIACRTVLWSRSKPRAISVSESGVSSRARYIASWRARATARRASRREQLLAAEPVDRRRPRPGSPPGSAAGGRRGGAPAGSAPSARLDERRRERLGEQRGDREHPGHRALEHAHVARAPGSRSRAARRARAAPAPRRRRAATGARSGSAGRAARARPASPQRKRSRRRSASRAERLGRPVAREHDLLAGGVQRVEGVDELLLGVLLALEHLDVVDQQRVELAVAGLEQLRAVAAQRAHELAREPLGGRVVDVQRGVVSAHVLGDRARAGASCRAPVGRAGRAGCRPRREARRPRARRRGRAGCRAR